MIEFDHTLKFIIVGEASVGKTVLLKRYIKDEFISDSTPTIGSDFFRVQKQVDDETILVQFWDTAGQERFRALTPKIYENCLAALIVYDTTCKSTFEKVRFWYETLLENCKTTITIMLVGNKTDLIQNRRVGTDEGRDYAREHGLLFMETSAKLNDEQCVQRAFDTIINTAGKVVVEEARKKEREVFPKIRDSILKIEQSNGKRRNNCC